MGDVLPLVRPQPRSRAETRRPCSCPDCRQCDTCRSMIKELMVSGDVLAGFKCSFAECPLKHVKTLDQVLADFTEVVLTIPAPAPKKKT